MNVILWARVSSREQKEGYSIDAQIRAMRDRAAKNGWKIVREFEVAESAKRGAERKAFNEMFKWAKRNAKREKIGAILSHKLDRVCRNMRDAVRLQDLEDSCGIKLAFTDNQFGPGAAGALSFNVMAAVAQYYSDNLRTEVLKGMDEKVRQGWPTGLAPFGYLNSESKEEPVIPHPEKAKTLIRIFELYSTGEYTFKSLAALLEKEGHIFRNSQPRFVRSALTYILKNRFYIGELSRNGKVHRGKYKILIDPQLFDTCQEILNSKNRRTGKPELMLSNSVLRCGYCDRAIAGEKIHRKLLNGGRNIHVYYRCGNNDKSEDHPKVRWKEGVLEEAIMHELNSFRFPSDRMAGWFRKSIVASFEDLSSLQVQEKRTLAKRRSEVTNMIDRLLNAYLAGTIEEDSFNLKSAELKREAEALERKLDQVDQYDAANGELALSIFDFSQNLADIWSRSNFANRRTILNCISLNRTITDVSLELTKRKPFDFLAERPFLKIGRSERI